jgi:molecular chaperone DnaK
VVQSRNQLDALVHSVRKSVGEYGEKVGGDEKAKIEAALKEAEELIKNKDASKERLDAQAETLGKAAQKLGEIMYAESQAKAQGTSGGGGGGGGAAGGGGEAKKDEKVVDAEYTEVDEKK